MFITSFAVSTRFAFVLPTSSFTFAVAESTCFTFLVSSANVKVPTTPNTADNTLKKNRVIFKPEATELTVVAAVLLCVAALAACVAAAFA